MLQGLSQPEADLEQTPEAQTQEFIMRTASLTPVRDEAGTTTAEYTVVTGAACAFGALLFKLLTSSWGERILETAFRSILKLLGF